MGNTDWPLTSIQELASAKTSQTANATLQKVLKSAEASVSLLQAHCDELKQSNANLLARTSELEQLLVRLFRVEEFYAADLFPIVLVDCER